MCTYFQHQIGSMTQLPLFGVRSYTNVIDCMSFYIRIVVSVPAKNEDRTC